MCVITTSIPTVAPSSTTTTLPQDDGGGLRKRTASTVSTTRTASTVSSCSFSESSVTSSISQAEIEKEEEEEEKVVVDIVASFEQVDSNQVREYFKTTGIFWDLWNPTKPWILVKDGSFMNNFDWVPMKFRVGPWHWTCQIYLIILSIFIYQECTHGWSTTIITPTVNDDDHDDKETSFSTITTTTTTNNVLPLTTTIEAYYDHWSWYYNTVGFLWTFYQCYNIWMSGMGWTSWGMYTIWSWTFTTIRHGLCAVAPLLVNDSILQVKIISFAEQIRFPMLVQATVTFGIWNTIIGPSIYAQMKTVETQQSFRRFFGNSLWRQMHVYNIVWATINGIWGSPSRTITEYDFATALAIYLCYAYFYVLCLDRFGVHYYLIFSPRTPYAVLSWTFTFGCYYICFPLWKTMIDKYAF